MGRAQHHIRPCVAQRGTSRHVAAEPRPSGAAPPSATRCKVDVTPEQPQPAREMFWYILPVIGLGVLAALAFLLCVGKKQAFYVRFW